MNDRNKSYLLYGGCLLVALFPIFCNLYAIPMQLWDESRLANVKQVNEVLSGNILPVIFLVLAFLIPYKEIVAYDLAFKGDIYQPKDRIDFQWFLKDVLHHDKNVDSYVFLDDGFEQDVIWYFKVFDLEHRPIKKVNKENIDPHAKLIVYRQESKRFLEAKYNTSQIMTIKDIEYYQLNGLKN